VYCGKRVREKELYPQREDNKMRSPRSRGGDVIEDEQDDDSDRQLTVMRYEAARAKSESESVSIVARMHWEAEGVGNEIRVYTVGA
jgi:hypothetical protein